MGLDMYLTRRTYVKNWDHQPVEDRHTITVGGPMADYIDTSKVCEIVEDVAYWRKANAIHQWFVDNCQDGIDDCRDAYVDMAQLEELYLLCKTLLTSRDLEEAQSFLPPQAGFFFGPTDDPEWYWYWLEETVEQLDSIITSARPEDDLLRVSYYYRSSW